MVDLKQITQWTEQSLDLVFTKKIRSYPNGQNNYENRFNG